MAGMGGVIGTVLGWLGHSVGLRDDAASASGSVHAKIKELRSCVNGLPDTKYIPFFVSGEQTFPDTPVTTVVNITNVSGELHEAMVNCTQDYTMRIRVVVDGVTIIYTGSRDHFIAGIINTNRINIADDGEKPVVYYNIPGYRSSSSSSYMGARLLNRNNPQLRYSNIVDGFSSNYAYNRVLIINSPIKFHNSLRVEINYDRSASSSSAIFQVSGMVRG